MFFFELALAADLRQFAVKFRSDQHGKPCPEPRHQRNPCAQRSLSLVKVSKVPKVEAEQIGESQPTAHRKDRPRHRG